MNAKQNLDPNSTSIYGAVGVACATVAVFISQKFGVDYTPEEATAITGALGVIFGFALSVLKRKA